MQEDVLDILKKGENPNLLDGLGSEERNAESQQDGEAPDMPEESGSAEDNAEPQTEQAEPSKAGGLLEATQPEATETEPDASLSPESPEQNEDDIPITDWSKVSLKMPDGFSVDQDVLAQFGKAAVDCGLNKKQAQKLVDWNIEIIKQARIDDEKQGLEQLQKAWGEKTNQNVHKTIEFVNQMDRKMGNFAFSKALSKSGASMDPDMIKVLFQLSQMTSEDSFGSGRAGAPSSNGQITIEQMLRNAAETQRKGDTGWGV